MSKTFPGNLNGRDPLADAIKRIERALEFAQDGAYDGSHHKMWAIDQMVRALLGSPMELVKTEDIHGTPYTYETQGESDAYIEWVRAFEDGEDGPHTYEWDDGIAP